MHITKDRLSTLAVSLILLGIALLLLFSTVTRCARLLL